MAISTSSFGVPRALRRHAALLAWLVALCALALFLLYAAWSWRNLQATALNQVGLYARALQTDTNATLNALGNGLLKAVEVGELQRSSLNAQRMERAMAASLADYPALSSVSVLDDHGRVLASSEPHAVGLQVPLVRLGTLPRQGAMAMGAWLPTRSLVGLDAAAKVGNSPGTIAMLHRIARPDGKSLLLVGLVAPEIMAAQHSVLVDKPAIRSALVTYEGIVLQRGANVPLQAGSSIKSLQFLRHLMPPREHGGHLGKGMDGAPAVVAFHTLRQWPLLVVVEQDYSVIQGELLKQAAWNGAALLCTWASLWLFVFLVHRDLASEESARAEEDRLHFTIVQSEQRLKLALESAGEGVWDLDLQAGELIVSSSVKAMLDYASDEVGDHLQDWVMLIHPQDVEPLKTAVFDHLAGRSSGIRCELRMRCKDGRWRWMMARGHGVMLSPGDAQMMRVIGTVVDISDRHETESALSISLARQQAILQSALDAIVTVDVHGHVMDFNRAAEEMFGRTQAEVIGKPMELFMAPQRDQELPRTKLARYFGTDDSSILIRRVETQAIRQDGTLFPVELSVVPVCTGDEALFTATLRDISDRKRVESALRDSEARARETFEQAAVGVIQQGRDGRFLRVNQTLCTMLGLSGEEFLALRPDKLLHPDHQERGEQALRRLLDGDVGSSIHEVQLRHQEGYYVWVRVTGSLAHSSSSQVYVIWIVEDIRERKVVETERKALLLSFQQTATELERQRLALDQHTLVSIVDPDGTLVYVNSRLCEVSGHHAHELIGRQHSIVARGQGQSSTTWAIENFAEIGEQLLEHVHAGKVWQGELLHRHKNGGPLWAASTVVPMLDAGGELHQIFVIQTDISRRIVAERAAADSRDVELQIGTRIQQSLLAAVPDQRLPRTWLSTHSRPSQGIDGDFMHVVAVGDDCVDLVTADVMGKGIGAALIAAAAKMQLTQCMTRLMSESINCGLPSPADVVAALHKTMVPSLQSVGAFITLSYVRIDSCANTITWVGCGHEEPLLVRVDGSSEALQNQHPPMGVLSVMQYEQNMTPFDEGDAFFACSDGLCDAINVDGSRVGREAVEAAVRRLLMSCKAPAAIVHALIRDLIAPGVRVVDDTTLLLAVRTGDTTNASRRELPYLVDALVDVRGLVEARCEKAGFEEVEASLFTLACVEAFSNIVRHSQGRLAESKIELVVVHKPGCLLVEFIYLADQVELPQHCTPVLEDYPEGGFGLSIMREATDRLEYEHHDGINTIRLTKNVVA
jgi:PAS domain S-box-containing protein